MTEPTTIPLADSLEVAHLIRMAAEYGAPDSYSGKRGAPRIRDGLRLELTTDLQQSGDVHAVSMHDISKSGLALWSKKKFQHNTIVYIREFSTGEARPWLTARVNHCTGGLRGFLVGVEFDLPASQD